MRKAMDPMLAPDGFAIGFRATEIEARSALSKAAEWLREAGISKPQALNIEIALAEAVNNVVEHAYAGRTCGEILVSCRINLLELHVAELHIVIEDRGTGLPKEELPPGNPADLLVPRDRLPEGGFGWFLIRELARDITYSRENGRNRLTLVFSLAQ